MASAACCECDANIDLKPGTLQNEILQCPECGVELEVTHLYPVKLEPAPQEEEDWGE